MAVIAYRHWELTSSCLEHLRRQTIATGVFLCDDGCDEGTAERIRAAHPEVTVVRTRRDMPVAVAYNAAVAAGDGEIVVMTNNDVDARPDFLGRLTAAFASRPCLGSVAPLPLRPGERQVDSAGLAADNTVSAFPRYKSCPPEQALADGETGLVLAGPDGAAAFRRAAWEQVGGLDEAIEGPMDDREETVLRPKPMVEIGGKRIRDGLADIDIGALIDYHREQGALATVTAVQPPGRFGAVELNGTDLKVPALADLDPSLIGPAST